MYDGIILQKMLIEFSGTWTEMEITDAWMQGNYKMDSYWPMIKL